MNTKNINNIKLGKVDIKRIMNGGGIVWDSVDLNIGPQKLIAGNMNAGFFGECATKELISGDELAKLVGLTDGVSQFSNEPWLKFAYLGNIEFIAKKTFRHSILWSKLAKLNLVYGDRIIKIKGKKFKIRLIKGKAEGQQDDATYDSAPITNNSEWNNLLISVHEDYQRWAHTINLHTKDWKINYTDKDLLTKIDYGKGSYSWCMERSTSNTYHLVRGRNGVHYSDGFFQDTLNTNIGWRPVLEVVK